MIAGEDAAITINALDSFGNLALGHQADIDLATDSGTVTGAGTIDIINGVGAISISDAIAETVNLSLANDQGAVGDITSTQDIIFDYPLPTKVIDTLITSDVTTFASSFSIGASQALSEDGLTLVVGAPADRFNFDFSASLASNNRGAAYVYTWSGSDWLFQQKITADNISAAVVYSEFGSSVAISGDTIAIGAYYDDYDANGDNFMDVSGAVYVYTRTANTWSFQQKLVGEGLNGRKSADYFGYSLSLDADTIVVGVKKQDSDASGANSNSDAGAAYVYTRTGNSWSFQQKLVGEGLNGRMNSDYFGDSVAIDADTIVVGTYEQDYDAAGATYLSRAGAAYVFIRSAGTWTFQQKLVGEGVNGRMTNDRFGCSLAIDGNTIAVGAYGQGYDADGANLKAGAGATYIFTRTDTTWTLQQKLTGEGVNGRVASDSFGTSVSLDGDTVAIGASGQDFDVDGANTLNSAGATYIFFRTGASWSLQQKITGEGVNGRLSSDAFGRSVSIVGNVLSAGASSHNYFSASDTYSKGTGAVFTYSRSVDSWTFDQKINSLGTVTPVARLHSIDANFGSAVAISDDSLTMVTSAPQDSSDPNSNVDTLGAGAAFVYIKSGEDWVLQQKLVAEGVNARMANDNFGNSLAIDGDTIAVGVQAQGYPANGAGGASSAAGAVFIYTRSIGAWTLQQ